jgi:hypothetical protein
MLFLFHPGIYGITNRELQNHNHNTHLSRKQLDVEDVPLEATVPVLHRPWRYLKTDVASVLLILIASAWRRLFRLLLCLPLLSLRGHTRHPRKITPTSDYGSLIPLLLWRWISQHNSHPNLLLLKNPLLLPDHKVKLAGSVRKELTACVPRLPLLPPPPATSRTMRIDLHLS